MNMRYFSVCVVCCAIAVGSACSNDSPANAEAGSVVVRVLDNSTVPVAGVEVSLSGTDFVGQTDRDGRVVFQVPKGNYFVDANVCCIGPGLIEHHKAVRVIEGKTVEVVLEACLACL